MTIQEFADLIVPICYGFAFVLGLIFGTWYFHKLLKV